MAQHVISYGVSGSIAWCSCGQGFSGARVEARADQHVKSGGTWPAMGAALIAALS